MNLTHQARKTIERSEEIESQLGQPNVMADGKRYLEYNRQRKALEEVTVKSRAYLSLVAEREEWERASRDSSDPEMQEMAKAEFAALEEKLPQMEEELKMLLVPRDPNDIRNAVLEIRAGAGGDEASIFAGDLYRMYERYIQDQGWRISVVDVHEGTAGGFKEIVAEVEGEGAYGLLKYESGVHRVQRVPATEASGRIHTSAASVVVMREADELDEIEIKVEDLRVDTYRASGSGGQHVNRTDSAVRLTHLPTGLVVACQDERSQHKNKDKAMKLLMSKLLDIQLSEAHAQEASARKSQVGTGDRSAKIRTYNFPQGRVTDHRINLTLYRLESIVNGDIQELIDSLRMAETTEKLKELEKRG